MQSSIAAAETVGHNEDLLKQLLLRLPAKSLIRFKCVSKLWLSLISSPKFCDSHTLRNPILKFPSAFFLSRTATTDPQFISLLPSTNPNPSKPLNFIPDPQGLQILQSCNGLLLCCSSTDKFTISRQFKFYVVNPTTSRFSEIALPPPSPTKPEPARLLSVALAFDPSKSLHYKLVCVSGSGTIPSLHLEIEIEIYSSHTRTWRAGESTHMWFPSIGKFLPGVYCNGRIHWLSTFCWLVYYDIDEEHYGVVDELGAPGFSVEKECMCFGESGGRLHLIEMYGSGLNKLRVLEMGKDYSGWFVKYRVDLNLMTPAFPYTPAASCRPFFFLDAEENEEQNPVLVLRMGYKFISYDIRDKSCKTLCDLFIPSLVGWRDAYQYMETLACV
ncbi:F-box protein At5g07610-like isoform X1 [Rosa rugosa]|uniref:F-box protein At5g07610-like isoform X1 n=1 Tax=Rosa rugosa TaxID=74645 RepID=UPI002B40AA39|nr:F-box protein At5g07610-like isoform X1 [Rosa rugosa]